MGYRRASRCSNCYVVGHTKRSCPALRQRAAEAAAKPANERGYYDERAIQQVSQYSGNNRTCSYCNETGHNAKGCKDRKDDIKVSTDYLITWRKQFIAKCKEVGFGIGSLVKHCGYAYEGGYATAENPHYGVVIGFDFSHITPWNFKGRHSLQGAINTKNLRAFAARYPDSIGIPTALSTAMGADNRYRYASDEIELVDAVAEIGIDTAPFVEREACTTIVLDMFNQKRRNKPLNRSDIRCYNMFPE